MFARAPDLFFTPLLLFMLGLGPLTGCDRPQTSSGHSPTTRKAAPTSALESGTPPGFRLWRLDLEVPGHDAQQIDELAARALWRAFAADGRAQSVGSRAQSQRLSFWFRLPVHVSAIELSSQIFGAVRLPDGSSAPVLEPAGPRAQKRGLHLIVDRPALSRAGLDLDGLSDLIRRNLRPCDPLLLQRLLALPLVDLGSPLPLPLHTLTEFGAQDEARSKVHWVLRAKTGDLAQLQIAQTELAERLLEPLGSDCMRPSWPGQLRLELDREALSAHGIRALQVHRQLALAQGMRIRPWSAGPLVLSHRPLGPDELGELSIRGEGGRSVPLRLLATLAVKPGPSEVLRAGPECLLSYLLLERRPNPCRAPGCRSIECLSDGERALLGWP